MLVALLVFPALASLRLGRTLEPRWIVSYVLATSISTFFVYRHDKKRAEAGGWRTPEFTLHVLESFGGWPGAFLAQRIYRHKTAKVAFQINFWIIVAVHEFAAFDFLNDWSHSKQAAQLVQQSLAGRTKKPTQTR